jgi:hypothetical protein
MKTRLRPIFILSLTQREGEGEGKNHGEEGRKESVRKVQGESRVE